MNFDYTAFQSKLAAIPDVFDREMVLLGETAKFYNSTNRAVDKTNNMCVYSAVENSPGCAIGRCLKRDSKVLVINLAELYINTDVKNLIATLPTEFPAWLKEMNINFLNDLQTFHDVSINWNNDGLSQTGIQEFERLKADILDRKPLTSVE